ncbi:hypothetical protein [Hyphomicrobium sp.]|uniref:hypothetical protein n=1 Tax=Hyphomicrobium sp. TaxID=82 RepID=UPI002E30400B|nr:hypothetical protein [Hyphomicrobium sp.]HEX2839988.1 hypothetical protein [Hyphomicrobium sp.]
MDGIKIGLCAIGAFYAFAGYVATRAALTSHFLDRAIAAIGAQRPDPRETAQTYWLLGAAGLVLAGGMALAFLLDVAVWLFLVSAAGQAVYLFFLAPRYFDAAEPTPAAGRRQSTNAFVIYLAATAFVIWAASQGKLGSWRDADGPLAAIPAGAFVAYVVYVFWMLTKLPSGVGSRSPLAGFGAASPEGSHKNPADCTRIKVMADYQCHPLWALDEDVYGDFAPEELNLSVELTNDLNAWAGSFTASLNPDDPAESLWSEDQHRAHEALARPLAIRLARELPDRMIYVLDREVGVVEVRGDEENPQPRGAGI